MKRILILFVLVCLFGCEAEGQNYFYLANDQDVTLSNYALMVDYYMANINNIESVNGQTIVNVPILRKFKKNVKTMIVDGYVAQYEKHGNDVTLLAIECDYIEFDFEKSKYSIKGKTDDDGMFDKPDKEKIKDKIKEKDKKP